jgi:hypothetical protein
MSGKNLHTKIPIHCRDCDWWSAAVDADRSCPRCGGAVSLGYPALKRPRRARARTFGKFGEVSPEIEAYVDAALRRAREDAGQ